ncbi:MAG TPA: hypothetical protein VN089_03990 [Duganella sp.]|nr:hypothetical protein [Duganella sp.]
MGAFLAAFSSIGRMAFMSDPPGDVFMSPSCSTSQVSLPSLRMVTLILPIEHCDSVTSVVSVTLSDMFLQAAAPISGGKMAALPLRGGRQYVCSPAPLNWRW